MEKIPWPKLMLSLALPFIFILSWEIALRLIGFNFFIPFHYGPLFEKVEGDYAMTPQYLMNNWPYNYFFVNPHPPFTIKKRDFDKRIIFVGDSSGILLPTIKILQCVSHKIGQKVELINMGFQGCGSKRAYHSLEEAIDLDPDLILLYTGHSEFLDHCNLKTLANKSTRPSPVLSWLLKNMRTAKWMWRTVLSFVPHKQERAVKMRRSIGKNETLHR